MNPNNTIVLGTSFIVTPSLLGTILWPHLIFALIAAGFFVFSCLFFIFKQRNQSK